MNTKTIGVSFLLVVSFLLLIVSLFELWGGINQRKVDQLTKIWQQDAYIKVPEVAELMVQHSTTVQKFNFWNAYHSNNIATLHEWLALQQPIWAEDAKQHRQQAIFWYHQSLQQRSTWGLAWIHLTQSEILNQQFDDATWSAFDKAITLSPWELPVQKKTIWLGIAVWDDLPEELQYLVNNKINHALLDTDGLNLDQYLIKVALRFNWIDHIKPLLTDEQTQFLDYTMNPKQ